MNSVLNVFSKKKPIRKIFFLCLRKNTFEHTIKQLRMCREVTNKKILFRKCFISKIIFERDKRKQLLNIKVISIVHKHILIVRILIKLKKKFKTN